MPKTIETVRRPVFKEDVLHSHIAETYFRQKARAKPRKKKQSLHINIDFQRLFITAAIIIASALIVSISATFLHKHYIGILQKNTASLKTINVISRGLVNKPVIKKVEFRGYARKGRSDSIKNAVILINPKKYNWADLAIDFKFPIDISKRNISLSVRGDVGGEKISVVLRDTKNMSYRLSDISLSSNMQEKIVRTKDIVAGLDLTKINHLRIEYGKPGESANNIDSAINVTLYINNLSFVKES